MNERSEKKVLLSGKVFRVQGMSGDRYFRDLVHDGAEYSDLPMSFIEKHSAPDSTILDIGSNIGLHSLAFSVAAPKGRIIAVDASANCTALLNETIRLNDVHNIEVVNAAISDQPGELILEEQAAFLAGSHVHSGEPTTANAHRIKAVTVDQLVEERKLDRVDVIKFDVEGFEVKALLGAKQTLLKHRPLCVLELSSFPLILNQRELPHHHVDIFRAVFPRVFYLHKPTFELRELKTDGDVHQFLGYHLVSGLVDDLVGLWGELPPVSEHFNRAR